MTDTPHDRRVTPVRDDLAADHLKGVIEAPRYARGTPQRVVTPSTPIRREAGLDKAIDTYALLGETFTVYEQREGWAWGQAEVDDYVGYVASVDLAEGQPEPEHVVAVARTFAYAAPDIKAPPLMALSLNALVGALGVEGRFHTIASGGYVLSEHLVAIGTLAEDFVAVAEQFVGVPYLWAGRDSLGIDCSGLVQAALLRSGVRCPRDSDMQEATLGQRLDSGAKLQRGDLVFWRGHVGIMIDADRLLHANATHMRTVIEPFDEAVARIAAAHGEVTSIRRLQ